jgi:hypothetical protein
LNAAQIGMRCGDKKAGSLTYSILSDNWYVIVLQASYGSCCGGLTFASKDQELRVHLVKIAIGILRADPKEDVTPARGWALEGANRRELCRRFGIHPDTDLRQGERLPALQDNF